MHDSSPLFFTSVAVAIFSCLASLATWRSSRRELHGTGLWFAGFVLYLLSMLSHLLRPGLSYSIQQIIANTFEGFGSYLQFWGFLYFYRCRKSPTRRVLLATTVVLNLLGALFLLYGSGGMSALCEVLNNFIPCIVTLGIIAIHFRQGKRSAIYALTVFCFMSLVLLARIALFSSSYAPSITENPYLLWGTFGPVYWTIFIAILVFSQNQMAHSVLLKRVSGSLSRITTFKERLLQKNEALAEANRDLISIVSDSLDARSSETSDHVFRVSVYTKILLDRMFYTGDDRELIISGAALHDIGKIGIPDAVLSSKGRYSEAEKKLMERHTVIGYDLLVKSSSPMLKVAAVIALEHHENWDGTGYPYGKRREEIAFASRVVAIADVFDALISSRGYKPSWPFPEAIQYIIRNNGILFDPELVAVVPQCIEAFREVTVSMRPEARVPGVASIC